MGRFTYLGLFHIDVFVFVPFLQLSLVDVLLQQSCALDSLPSVVQLSKASNCRRQFFFSFFRSTKVKQLCLLPQVNQ